MMLTDLADAARTSGLPVIEVAGWRTRGALDKRGNVQGMTSVRGVTCHHTAGALTGNYPSLATVRDGRSNLAGPLAHLGLGRDGTVYVIAAGLANHAGISLRREYENPYRIGIEAEYHPTQGAWPVAQLVAYVALCAALARWYHIPISEVLGHKETCAPVGRKPDPAGIDMADFRRQVAAKLAPPKPKPAPHDDWEATVADVTFIDSNRYAVELAAGKSDAEARRIATVTYPDATAALAGMLGYLSAVLRDVAAIKAGAK